MQRVKWAGLAALLSAASLTAPLATAAPAAFEDLDTEVARNHYSRGRALYEEGRYEAAIAEFEFARTVLHLPALDYNLALCEERLEHWSRAITLYEAYLDAAPVNAETPAVQQRIATLRARLGRLRTPEPPPARPSLHVAAIAVGAGAVGLAAVGTGAYFSAWGAYAHERDVCSKQTCSPADIASTRTRVERAEHAGYALWGLAGAAAVADVALWVVDTREHRRATAAHAAWDLRVDSNGAHW